MKRLSIILMACLMVLGLSQCKKENQNANTDPEGVKITLNVDNGGERVTVTPGETVTSVTFDDGDVILVANGGHYVGSLTRINEAFTGTITAELTTSDKLHFFFVGNKVVPSSLTEGSSTGCTVDMSDQSDGPAVVSYASMDYDGSLSVTANVKLMNKASGLMKFTTSEGTTNDITISGVYNKINITFSAEPTIATDQTERGTIKLNRYTGDTENKTFLAIIPEQVGVENVSVSVDGFTAENIEITAVEENTNSAVSISLTAVPSAPVGAINGLFTINASGGQVYFSQGNLQYIGSAATPYWQFAGHQWDYLGENGQNSSSQTADRDLFGWGTSGYSHGAIDYQPWATSYYGDQYYAYGNSSYHLYDQTGQADWGYNAIANGGNQENSGWRTLTKDEWVYVFNSRTDAASKWGHGNVNGVNGMILLPDAWTLPEGLNFTSGNSSWANVYNAEQWAQMEANGAVFLPAAGDRFSTSLNGVGTYGRYWSSSYNNNMRANDVYFNSGELYYSHHTNRYYGYSVRLVRNAE